jgi:mitogen-activated protein kinase 1/3
VTLSAAIDLLTKMLAFDPGKRCTVQEALEHPYFEDIYDPSEIPQTSAMFDFEFEEFELTKEEFKGSLDVVLFS